MLTEKRPKNGSPAFVCGRDGAEADNAPSWSKQSVKNELAFCAFVYVALAYSLFVLYSVTLTYFPR